MNDSSPLHLFRGVGIELEYMIVARDTLDVLPVADKVLRTAGSSAPLYTGRPAGAGDEEPGSGGRVPEAGGDTPAMNDRAASPQRQAGDSIPPPAFRDPGSRSPDPDAPGEYPCEVELGDLCWSNELVLHVIELKTNGPATSLDRLSKTFHRDVTRINDILAPMGGCLMSSAAHPWMNPDLDTKLWPHDYGEIYRAFDKIFGCRGHGWSNLQSMHINLPFADDAEFARLHAAIRLVLPIIPALAASSPIIDGRLTGLLDSRLAFYRTNCRRIPSVTGCVIPEAVFTQRDYEEQILQRIYRDIAPHDPDETLRDEWVNARGAIARFCRNTIEIRVIDMQECPSADVAIAA
ncbi:MAG TPA: glutamate-cysteine ligase family protein, partial [Phycisphaerae bacterium]|nr:glutamate-cysteine ligase family protein [Phycisphaerae bacterium]